MFGQGEVETFLLWPPPWETFPEGARRHSYRNIYMDGIVREANAGLQCRGLSLLSDDGSEWNMNQLLLADDTALVGESQERVRQPLMKFWRMCERRKLRVNVSRMVDDRIMNVALNESCLRM